MSEGNERLAEDVIEAIVKGDAPNGEYVLDGKTIKGKFDLRLRVVSVTVKITNCTFEDEVDLSYSEFKQCVDFSGSIFRRKFNSGTAIYRKGTICNEAIFESEVSFDGIQCELSIVFENARFEGIYREIDFTCARFGSQLNCIGAVFKGGAIFNGIQCEDAAFFENTKFENEEKDIDFGYAKFGTNLYCTGAEFNGGAIFNGIQCEGNGFFDNAKFENAKKDIDFGHAKFANLDCTGVVLKGGANFNGIQCEGNGFFRNARFENTDKDIRFARARFGIDLDCDGAVFEGSANFYHIQCEENGFFRGTKFINTDKNINFHFAKFGTTINFDGAIFEGGASFNAIQCEDGFFKNTQFRNANKYIDFSNTKFGVNLEFQDAIFEGGVSFFHAQILRVLVLINTAFQKYVNLSCANLHTFWLEDSRKEENYGTFRDYINLQRLEFTVFQGTKDLQKYIVDRQAPDEFSMDPYLQFEKYYNSIGDDSYAKDVYFSGRTALRKYKYSNRKSREKDKSAFAQWFWFWVRHIFDYLSFVFLGYGAKLWITVAWLILFLFTCVGMFWSDETMMPKTINANNSGFIMTVDHKFQNDLDKGKFSNDLRKQFQDRNLPIPDQVYIATTQYGSEWYIDSYPSNDIIYGVKLKEADIRIYKTIYPDYKRFFHRLGYSLDMLLPVVDLKIADEYRFPSSWRGGYMVIHILAGWILIPLLISSLAGVLRKR